MNKPTNNIYNIEKLKAGLYLVATPIGNLRDITFRALDILSSADLILCEDTRITGKLLSYYEIKNKLVTYNDHSTEKQRDRILQQIIEGKSIALASDAGMPLISDPGYKLIKQARTQNLFITSAPGANAPLTALQLSGLPTNKFTFLGFLPPKETARRKTLLEWKNIKSSLIIFESGPRLLNCLKDIKQSLGNRLVSVSRELTKMFEEVKTQEISELIKYYEEKPTPKGEIVVVISQGEDKEFNDDEINNLLLNALSNMKVKEAATYVAEITGKPKKELYNKALNLKNNDD